MKINSINFGMERGMAVLAALNWNWWNWVCCFWIVGGYGRGTRHCSAQRRKQTNKPNEINWNEAKQRVNESEMEWAKQKKPNKKTNGMKTKCLNGICCLLALPLLLSERNGAQPKRPMRAASQQHIQSNNAPFALFDGWVDGVECGWFLLRGYGAGASPMLRKRKRPAQPTTQPFTLSLFSLSSSSSTHPWKSKQSIKQTRVKFVWLELLSSFFLLLLSEFGLLFFVKLVMGGAPPKQAGKLTLTLSLFNQQQQSMRKKENRVD